MLEFAGRFSDPKLLIKDFEFWAVVYKQNPQVLGQVVFVLKRQVASMGDVYDNEFAELPMVCKWFEAKTKKLFGAKKFNYTALMLKEEFVHFNAYPRYDKQVEKYGKVWIDENWPKKVSENKLEIDTKTQNKIIADFKK